MNTAEKPVSRYRQFLKLLEIMILRGYGSKPSSLDSDSRVNIDVLVLAYDISPACFDRTSESVSKMADKFAVYATYKDNWHRAVQKGYGYPKRPEWLVYLDEEDRFQKKQDKERQDALIEEKKEKRQKQVKKKIQERKEESKW